MVLQHAAVLCLLTLSCFLCRSESYPRVVFVLLSQPHPYHVNSVEEVAASWRRALTNVEDAVDEEVITITQPHRKVFSLVPAMSKLATSYKPEAIDWFFFGTDQTQVNFTLLGQVLRRYVNCSKCQFLGHSIHDEKPSIIHHFLLSQPPHLLHYPLLHSGFVLRSSLLHLVAQNASNFSPVFSLDPLFELSVFLRYLTYPELVDMFPNPPPPHSMGVSLVDVPEFCSCEPFTRLCASYCSRKTTALCDGKVRLSEVFFAVKTCKKFHESRLPIVQRTWGATDNIRMQYYSDEADPEYKTVYGGVPNSEKGHCEKTMAIINLFRHNDELRDTNWLVIADDDTLLSVPRLLDLLACYNSSLPTLLGELYGYEATHSYGYLFVTGGGGMVLNRAAVEKMMSPTMPKCPSSKYADDMFLGALASQKQIYTVHSEMFRQNQPNTYHPELIASHDLVTFHRHTPVDPITVYKDYLQEEPTHSTDHLYKQHEKSEL